MPPKSDEPPRAGVGVEREEDYIRIYIYFFGCGENFDTPLPSDEPGVTLESRANVIR